MTQLVTRQEGTQMLHVEMIQQWINVIGQVAPSSKQSYTFSAVTFHTWLLDHQHTLETVDRSGMIAYRDFLASRHAKATATRKWSSILAFPLSEFLYSVYLVIVTHFWPVVINIWLSRQVDE